MIVGGMARGVERILPPPPPRPLNYTVIRDYKTTDSITHLTQIIAIVTEVKKQAVVAMILCVSSPRELKMNDARVRPQ